MRLLERAREAGFFAQIENVKRLDKDDDLDPIRDDAGFRNIRGILELEDGVRVPHVELGGRPIRTALSAKTLARRASVRVLYAHGNSWRSGVVNGKM